MKNKEISDEKFEEVLDSIEDLEKIEENKKNDEEIVEKTEGFFESFKKKNSKNEKFQEEINDLKDQNLRIYADFENVKRRLKEDNIRQMKFANEKFAFDILDILDTLELSLQYISVEKEKEGIVNTISKFKNILSNYNITEVSYEVFSPNEH
jgi:molecular chaperone GrpE